jgi:uncharacterized phage protein (TIGR01671 family)
MRKNNMREILYRGKRVDNGGWVFGAYLPPVGGYPPNVSTAHEIRVVGKAGLFKWHEVISETVGEYTGLTDKNDVKIFEGDIVKTTVKITAGQAETVVHVFFSELCASFMLAGGILCSPEFMHKNRKYAVIGNIHDTPELLSGGNGK